MQTDCEWTLGQMPATLSVHVAQVVLTFDEHVRSGWNVPC